MSKQVKKLSVVAITFNSAQLLRQFLDAVRFADEVVIVDGGSSDSTQQIALQCGATVYRRKFDGYGMQKAFGLSKATGTWILLLDVDEIVSVPLAREIRRAIARKNAHDAYYIPYQNHIFGRPLKTLEQYGKVRLFRRGSGSVERKVIHEEMVITGRIGKLQHKLLHYSYRSISQTVTKFTHYAKYESALWYRQGRRASLLQLCLNPLHMLWAIFISDKGYRDGVWGLLLAVLFAYYEFARYWFFLIKRAKN